MKYLTILALVLSGCASTPSNYEQGCQDGVQTFVEENLHTEISQDYLEEGCANLQKRRFPVTQGRREK